MSFRKTKTKKTVEIISTPPFVGVLWIHAFWSTLFVMFPAIVSGINGEQIWSDIQIYGYQLPKYCPIAAYLLIASFINVHIFQSKISFKKKFWLHHITMITYLGVLLVSGFICIKKVSAGMNVPVTLSKESLMLPIGFLVNWCFCFYIEHLELKKKGRELEKC